MQSLWSVFISIICILAARIAADGVTAHGSQGSGSEAYVVDHSASDPYGAEQRIWDNVEKAGRGIVELAKKTAPGIKKRASTITQWAETQVTRVEELMDRKKEQVFNDMLERMGKTPQLAVDPQVHGLFTLSGDVKPTVPIPAAPSKDAPLVKRGLWGVPRGNMRKRPAADASTSVDGGNSDRSVEEGQQSIRSATPSSSSSSTTTASTAIPTPTTTTTTTTTSTDADVAIKNDGNNIDSDATTAESGFVIIDKLKGHAIVAGAMVTAAAAADVNTYATYSKADDLSLAHVAEGTVAGEDRVSQYRGTSQVTISVRAVNNGGTRVASPVEAFTTEASHHQAFDRAMTGSDEEEDDEEAVVLVITSTFTPFKQPPAALTHANLCATTAVGVIICYADDKFTYTTSHQFASDRPIRVLLTSAGGRAPGINVRSAAPNICLGTTTRELMLPHPMERRPPLLSDLAFASTAMDATAGPQAVQGATTTTPSTTSAPTASHDAVRLIDDSGQGQVDSRNAAANSSGGDTSRTSSTVSTAQGSVQALPASTPSVDAQQEAAVLVITSTFTPFKKPPAALTHANLCATTAVGVIICYADDKFTYTTSHGFSWDRPIRVLLTSAGGRAPGINVKTAAPNICLGTTTRELMLPHPMERRPPLLSDLPFASTAMDATGGSQSIKGATTTTPSTTSAHTASHDAVRLIDGSGQGQVDSRNAAANSSGGDTTRTRSTVSTAQGSVEALQASTPSADAQQVWGTQNEGSKLTTGERMARHDLMFMPDKACPQGYLCLRPKSMPDAGDISPSDYLLFMLLDTEADSVGTPSPTKTTATLTAAAITDRCAAMLMVARGVVWADIIAQGGAALRDLVRVSNVILNDTRVMLSDTIVMLSDTISRLFGRHTGVGRGCTPSTMANSHQSPTTAPPPSIGSGGSSHSTRTAASTNSPLCLCRPPSTPQHNVTQSLGLPSCARESVHDAGVPSSSSAAAVSTAPRAPVGGASMTHAHPSAHTPMATSAGSLGSRDLSVYYRVGLRSLRARSKKNSTHSTRGDSMVVKVGALVAAWCLAAVVIAVLVVILELSHRRRQTGKTCEAVKEKRWRFWAGWGEFVEELFTLEGLLGCNDEEVEEWVVSEEERYRSRLSAANDLPFEDMWYHATGRVWDGDDIEGVVTVGDFFRGYKKMVRRVRREARVECLREAVDQVEGLKSATYEWGEEGCKMLVDMLEREEREAARHREGGVCGEEGEGMGLDTIEEEGAESERDGGQEDIEEDSGTSDVDEEEGQKEGQKDVQQVVDAAVEAPVSGVSNGHAVLAALVKAARRIKAQREGRVEVEEEEEEREEW